MNYVISWAQNNTPLHKEFYRNLQKFARDQKASLIVIGGEYLPGGRSLKKDVKLEWECPVVNRRMSVSSKLNIFGDVNILPTAITPLTGFEVFAGEGSAIFGHPKYQHSSIATADPKHPRLFTTTGAVTRPNYSKSRAGARAKAHHVYGAILVRNLAPNRFICRHVNAASDGSFIDLGILYRDGVSKPAPPAAGLVVGDAHVALIDSNASRATFGMIKALRPPIVVLHDVHDHHIDSHHSTCLDLEESAHKTVRGEVEATCHWITQVAQKTKAVYVVESNHHRHLDKWLERLPQPKDRAFWHALNYLVRTRRKPALQTFFDAVCKNPKVKFLDSKTPTKIRDVYVHFHGDRGIDGSRGSTLAYSRLGCKSIKGHSHSPGVRDGVFTVGTIGKLDMGYNHPPSSWGQANCVIYANGKRALLHIIDGRWV